MTYLSNYWGLHLALAVVSFVMIFGSIVGGMSLVNSKYGDSAPFLGIIGGFFFFVLFWVNAILCGIGIISNLVH